MFLCEYNSYTLSSNFVWDFALSKLYTNSLLSTLNARVGWNNVNGVENDTNNVLFGSETAVPLGFTHLTGSYFWCKSAFHRGLVLQTLKDIRASSGPPPDGQCVFKLWHIFLAIDGTHVSQGTSGGTLVDSYELQSSQTMSPKADLSINVSKHVISDFPPRFDAEQ